MVCEVGGLDGVGNGQGKMGLALRCKRRQAEACPGRKQCGEGVWLAQKTKPTTNSSRNHNKVMCDMRATRDKCTKNTLNEK